MTISSSAWRNLKVGLAMLMTGAMLAACGGGDAPPVAPCDAGFQTVLNAVATSGTAAATGPTSGPASVKKSAAAVPAGTLRIHYQRPDSIYTGWQVYTFSPEVLGGWPGSDPTDTDAYGAYWDVPVGAAASVNFIIHKGDSNREPSSWPEANGDQQQFWNMADGNEIWKISGDSTNYTVDPTTILPDVTTVRVHYKRFDGDYAKWGLNFWNGSGVDTTQVTAPSWDDAANFDAMPNYGTDAFGIKFELPVINPTVSEASYFEFQIHGDAPAGGVKDNKDGWGDNNIRVAFRNLTIDPATKTADIWVVQETATVYYSLPDLRSVSTRDAKAFALNGTLVKWPRVDATGSFKLYYSATAALRVNLGSAVTGADGSLDLEPFAGTVPAADAERFKYVAPGVVLTVKSGDEAAYAQALTNQAVLVQLNDAGQVQNATTVQIPAALDSIYAAAQEVNDFGVKVAGGNTNFKLWAPTAQTVSVCVYDTATGKAQEPITMTRDDATGAWTTSVATDLTGKYYKYMVTVFVRGVGIVRNLVTDPYSISLTANSKRSYIANLDDAALKPAGWDDSTSPALAAQEDMSIYELHVRDFSVNDSTVPPAHSGKYLAFADINSDGMKHLKALADAGLTDIHLLPIFDIGTIPEVGCTTPAVSGSGSSMTPQKTIAATADKDCYNWGYDPEHYTALEGSYATDPVDGAVRIREFRQAVMALHGLGLRVGMDVVYNHTTAAGQNEKAVLDRVVPGYYHRYDTSGNLATSTCCANTATENKMMGKLMIDSVVTLATQYKLDSFRFDLMAHQPRSVMEELKTAVNAATGRDIYLVGEGWNFGEVANGARFVQASQLSLNGSGIATFTDRARDAARGGSPFDKGTTLLENQGFLNGLYYADNGSGAGRTLNDLLYANDMVKVGLAGSIRSYSMVTRDNATRTLEQVDYNGQPAGYVVDPQEVVNYVENHDNQTLFDINVMHLPLATSKEDRARVQMLGAALTAFSQGVGYFHAGIDTMRSKSLDRNSYNSGDWFNRLDWTYTTNYFGIGLPQASDNSESWDVMDDYLDVAADITPTAANIAWTRDMFRELLAVRKSSTLFRMRTADDIKSRLQFYNTGASMEPTVIAYHLNGVGYAGANYDDVMVLINVGTSAKTVTVDAEKAKSYVKHPALTVDTRLADATYDSSTGAFVIPPRTAVVWVQSPAVGIARR